ncbi:hypothetical protein [Metabacillus hrfriensis]|uniref:Uncharacterized protein n=1 Tax=Metabacillus hrfriensis TaxID=3048891 RepID=A0ACD4RHY8_9BACI|nr:hypothetical protein [Metabacillus sp. CT-WN-B3]WHZ60089.1 hypothetical protein QLQ22_12470 [Metabacillus sp. CT-WN-B3]
MKIVNLVEMVEFENKTQIIVTGTKVRKDVDYLSDMHKPYLIYVEGLFKEKKDRGFSKGAFTVTLFLEDGTGEWSVHSSEEDTYNFFRLSSSSKPSERSRFLCYCLNQEPVLDQMKEDFGEHSEMVRWVQHECPISLRDV